ncbi:hypothetical protein OIV83_001355 [Microbotryomycetes sp. JL201]|nr:hypothetical protein OIV83_001355 [Microbotryomycetes sp. JL201]
MTTKHLAQNKEIIHKNSELNKTNAELNRTLTLLRAERLSLKGSHFQLECENASLRTQVDRAQQRQAELQDKLERLQHAHGSGSPVDQEQIDIMRQSLVNAVASLQACLSILPLPSNVPANAPSTPPPRASLSQASSLSAPVNETSSSRQEPTDSTNVSISRRRSLANKQGRLSITAMPDLSYISEGAEASAEEHDNGPHDDGEGGANWWGGPVLEGLREETSGSQPVSAQTSPVQLSSIFAMASPAPIIEVDITASPTSEPVDDSARATSDKTVRKRAPPAAPSASARENVEQRPPRRASGLLKKPLASRKYDYRNDDTSEEDVDDDDEDFVEANAASKNRSSLTETRGDATTSASTNAGCRTADAAQRRPIKTNITQAAKLVKQAQTSIRDQGTKATSSDRRTAISETMNGTIKARSSRKIQSLDAVNEEASSSRPPENAEESQDPAGEGGRRARKSVNYALPKLNTKMRRPEDYVPQTYAASNSKGPRKSTKTPLSSSSFSQLDRSGSSSTDHISVDENDKPDGVRELVSGALDQADEPVDSFDEVAFLKNRANSVTKRQSLTGGADNTTLNITMTRAGHEIEGKGRDRLSVKNGLLNKGPGVAGRRHSTAV